MFGKKKNNYGVISCESGVITVYAPSGTEALHIAGMDGVTAEGENFIVANHKGNGIFEIKTEPWPRGGANLRHTDAPHAQQMSEADKRAWDQAEWEIEHGINPWKKGTR